MNIKKQIHSIAVGIVGKEFSGSKAASLADEITTASLKGLQMVRSSALEELVKKTALQVINARINLIQHDPKVLNTIVSLDELSNLTEHPTESRYEELAELFGDDGRPVLEHAVQGYTTRETGLLIGKSQRSVESIIRRAKRRYLKKVRTDGGKTV